MLINYFNIISQTFISLLSFEVVIRSPLAVDRRQLHSKQQSEHCECLSEKLFEHMIYTVKNVKIFKDMSIRNHKKVGMMAS
jgi:hypothetical protein